MNNMARWVSSLVVVVAPASLLLMGAQADEQPVALGPFAPQFFSLNQKLLAASATSRAGLGPARMSVTRCPVLGDCQVLVYYDGPRTSTNRCGIRAPDVLVVPKFGPSRKIRWTLVPPPPMGAASQPAIQFVDKDDHFSVGGVDVNGIHFQDLDDDPNVFSPDPPASAASSAVLSGPERAASAVEGDTFKWTFDRSNASSSEPKAHYYAIIAKYLVTDGNGTHYELCDPYDPVAVNQGK